MQKTTLNSIDLANEAIGLLDFFGGWVPDSRDSKLEANRYFLNREIPQEHWNNIYCEALTLQSQQ